LLNRRKTLRIGIIRCQEHSSICPACHCLEAAYAKGGPFSKYDKVEIVGIDTCGGCYHGGAKKIIERALILKDYAGAEVIHLSDCIVDYCPWKKVFEKGLREKVGLPVELYTHYGYLPPVMYGKPPAGPPPDYMVHPEDYPPAIRKRQFEPGGKPEEFPTRSSQ
jgi:predicted metal-binding protein